MKAIAPNCPDIPAVAGLHQSICPLYKIDSYDIFHEFIANELHESAEFNVLSESMNYSAASLITDFSRARISYADAMKYGRIAGKQKAKQQEIANILYGGKFGRINLGNIKDTDGWIFRGAGPMQLTGRGNITRFAAYYNKLTVSNYSPEQMSALLRTDIAAGIHSACWIFAVAKDLIDEAEKDQMKEIVKKINGGYFGLQRRMAYYEKAQKIFV